MMQREFVRAPNAMIAFPLVGGAVGALLEKPVKHGEENRALDTETELAAFEFALDHAAEAEVLP